MMNRRVKGALALVLAAAMIIPAAGCGKKDKSKDKVVLEILDSDTARTEGYLDKLLAAFNEKYADQGIETVDANMHEFTNLAEDGPNGCGPDIEYQANDVLMKFASGKHIAKINPVDYECYGKVPQEAWDAFKITVDGEEAYCGVPVNVDEPMLFYRKDKLPDNWESDWDDDKNSVPDFLENWNDLYAYSKLLRDTDESTSKTEQYGLLAALSDYYMSSYFLFSYDSYVFGFDGKTYDTEDIGVNSGNSAKGMLLMKDFAELMTEGCADASIKTGRYEFVADGTAFCSISTPNTYSLFYDKLAAVYEAEGLSETEAKDKAKENLVMTEIPGKLPADGNITQDSSEVKEWTESVCMGGISGYAISSYTKHPKECALFIDFATSYDQVASRTEELGIAPVRSDAAGEGDVTQMIFDNLKNGEIYLMPPVSELSSVWDPIQTLMADVTLDAFRKIKGQVEKYPDVEHMQDALDTTAKTIYDKIYTLADEGEK